MADWQTDLWAETIECSFEEHGITATTEQLQAVAADVQCAHENWGMATGLDVATANFKSDERRQIEDLQKELRREQNMVTCRTCNGFGYIRINGPYHYSDETCHKCNGRGRHD